MRAVQLASLLLATGLLAMSGTVLGDGPIPGCPPSGGCWGVNPLHGDCGDPKPLIEKPGQDIWKPCWYAY